MSEETKNKNGWWGEMPEDGTPGMGEIKVVGGHVYFYMPVTQESILKLNDAMRDLEIRLLTQAIESGMDPYPIKLHIHSFGGSVFAGVAAMDSITNLSVDVHTIVEGGAASAATFISLAGNHRVMSKNSYILIHQLSSGYYGKYNEIKDEVENLDELMNMIKRIYNERSNVPSNKLDEILKHDLWFSSKKCLKYGLVDEVI